MDNANWNCLSAFTKEFVILKLNFLILFELEISFVYCFKSSILDSRRNVSL